MKTLTQKLLVAAAIVLAASTTASAQVFATATASATIITPIDITKVTDMKFGNIAVSAALGTVTIPATAAGTRSSNGGITLPATTGTFSAASFTVAGEKSYTYAITIPTSAVPLSDAASDPVMNVDGFVSSLGATGTLDASLGTQTLYVGATLHVAASQPAGTYTSATPFSVTVNYN